jgi:hypothetical protein
MRLKQRHVRAIDNNGPRPAERDLTAAGVKNLYATKVPFSVSEKKRAASARLIVVTGGNDCDIIPHLVLKVYNQTLIALVASIERVDQMEYREMTMW